MSRGLTFARCRQIRWYSKEKMKVIETVDELISNEELRYKHHPGIIKPKQVEQPEWLLKTVRTIMSDESISPKLLHESGQRLASHLTGRHPPPETEDIRFKFQQVQARVKRAPVDDITDTTQEEELLRNPKARRLFKELVYNWVPVQYDKYTSLSYLINRSVPEYSVLHKIFNEIKTNDANFTPKSLFDFGSGVGTAMWAASQFWYKSIKEYLCIDTSTEINELSEYLSKRTKPQINPNYIFYKEFLPTSSTPTSDIVVSAYSLFELPNQKSRLEVISKLWHKTEQYLIIVEQGTRAGFNIINEAREFILNYTNDASDVHVVSPCPHDSTCPRYMTDDNTPCNFELVYLSLPLFEKSAYIRERYSYVVFKKGKRPEDDCQWPRIVRPVLKRSKHVICRLCTASGKLDEQIFTTWKNGKNTYRCARASEWGDRLPFKIEKSNNTEEPE
ncbi:ribosome assembly protein METTL17, mitochondrial isoform X1 [Andrena cerasifolii]|uniref:ribosome assembly protein METTL17, mitochondrial isoform X1 n=2 Tax=Andrena cerasifolii TaxID=2819439 RepID=UPI004037C723